MIHMARLPTPCDPPSENVAISEKTADVFAKDAFAKEEDYQAFLNELKKEKQSIQASLEPEALFERLEVGTKDFIKTMRTLNDDELSALLMHSSKIVKDHKNFDQAYADAYLNAEKRDFKLSLIVRGVITVATAGLLSMTGPGAAVGFMAVMFYIQGTEMLQRKKRTPEFALTRLALLEQEDLKRKLLAKQNEKPQDAGAEEASLGSQVQDETIVRNLIKQRRSL